MPKEYTGYICNLDMQIRGWVYARTVSLSFPATAWVLAEKGFVYEAEPPLPCEPE